MSKEFLEFIVKFRNNVGTRKFRICLGMGALNFIALLMILEDEPIQEIPQNNLIENNKEEN